MAFKDTVAGLAKSKLVPFIKNTTTQRVGIATATFVLITIILAMNFLPNQLKLKPGDVAPETIKAPRSIEFEDKLKTAEAKRLAALNVGKVHDEDPGAFSTFSADVDSFFNTIRRVQAQPATEEKTKLLQLKEELSVELPDQSLYEVLLSAESNVLQTLNDKVKEIVKEAMEAGVFEENLDITKKRLQEEQVEPLDFVQEYKTVLNLLIENFLRPNFIYNEEATTRKTEAAVDAVSPVRVSVKQGEKIVGEGEIVTQDQVQKLEALGVLKERAPVKSVVGIAFLVALSLTVVMVFLYQYNRNLYHNEGHLLLLGLIVVVSLMVAKIIIAIEINSDIAALLGYMVPFAATAMLISILLDSKLALLVNALLAGMLGIITGNQISFALVNLFTGTVAVFSVSRLSQRSDLMKAGLIYISVAHFLGIIAVEFVTKGENASLLLVILSALSFGLINGIFSSVLAIGLLPFLESAFGITSAVKLLELANPGQPLLKRLLLEAPGTYHHSIVVGNLAEAAADAVGGESLLVRVGAYYHDIGKLKRPYFFIENQLSCENPHDKIAPTLSTLIITSHTKDGVELARENKLPQPIIDIVEQHHGTSLVSFFFNKALENDKNEKTVTEEDFRYEGSKPQTKEAALVMMADSVEAAVRSLQKPTPGRIEGLVRRIIKDKLQDGQLDECDLTFKDLDVIANTFVRVLSGIFHARVEYPETVLKEIERRNMRDASLRK